MSAPPSTSHATLTRQRRSARALAIATPMARGPVKALRASSPVTTTMSASEATLTPSRAARATGERVRAAVARHVFEFDNRPIAVTVSVGVAQLLPGETHSQLYERGDALLYASKHAGRNSVSG